MFNYCLYCSTTYRWYTSACLKSMWITKHGMGVMEITAPPTYHRVCWNQEQNMIEFCSFCIQNQGRRTSGMQTVHFFFNWCNFKICKGVCFKWSLAFFLCNLIFVDAWVFQSCAYISIIWLYFTYMPRVYNQVNSSCLYRLYDLCQTVRCKIGEFMSSLTYNLCAMKMSLYHSLQV